MEPTAYYSEMAFPNELTEKGSRPCEQLMLRSTAKIYMVVFFNPICLKYLLCQNKMQPYTIRNNELLHFINCWLGTNIKKDKVNTSLTAG